MRPFTFAVTIGLAALIALSASARAQNPELTADEVKNCFIQVQRDATELLQKGDVERIAQWSERHVADDAHFKVSVQAVHESTPKMWSVIDLDKADINRLQILLGQTVIRSIQDYSLRIDIGKVVPHGADAATVTVTWSDSFKVAPPAPTAPGQAQNTVGQAPQAAAQPRTVDVKRILECDHLLVREQGQLKIGLSNCRGQAQF
jgi:hypothetical protein